MRWLVFGWSLSVFEPFTLHHWWLARFETRRNLPAPLHRILLFISLITVLGAVLGSHGLPFFQSP